MACSLGSYYGKKCTRKLGYKELQDEYIIMGMSSYGEVSQKHLKILNDHWDMIMSIPTDKEKKKLAQYAWLESIDFKKLEDGKINIDRVSDKRTMWSWSSGFNDLKHEDVPQPYKNLPKIRLLKL